MLDAVKTEVALTIQAVIVATVPSEYHIDVGEINDRAAKCFPGACSLII